MVLVDKSERKRPIWTPRHRRAINIKSVFRKCNVGSLTGLSWLRIGTVGGHLSLVNEAKSHLVP